MSSMYRALTVVSAAILGACAQQPPPAIRYGGDREGSESLALADARAIDAARRHPNAQPRVRPEYPEQAPPPLPAGQSLPAPLHITRRSYAAAPAPSNVLVERTVYDDSGVRYRPWYGYGYSYRRPWGAGWDPYGGGYGGYGYGGYGASWGLGVGLGLGWNRYGYGSYYPGSRYGYGYGVGLGSRHHHHNWGFSRGFGGFGGRGGFGHVRSVSGRRR